MDDDVRKILKTIKCHIKHDRLAECLRYLEDEPSCYSLDFRESFSNPLHTAAKHGRDAFIPALVLYNSEFLNHVNSLGYTPVCRAAEYGNLSTVLLLVKLQCKLSPDYDVDDDADDARLECSLLNVAAEYGRDDIIEAVHHLDNTLIDVRDTENSTPLEDAVFYNQLSTVKLLIRLGSKSLLPDADYPHPMHFAAWKGYREIMELFLELGVCIDVMEKNYRAPIHYAKHPATIEYLDERGSSIIHGNNGLSVLQLMIDMVKYAELFKTIVRLGCNYVHNDILKQAIKCPKNDVIPIATLITLFPDYLKDYERLMKESRKRRQVVMKMLEDDEFCGSCRYEVFFAEPLVVRLLREDRRLARSRWTSKTNRH